MHCKHCGNQIENDSIFCSFCGNKVNNTEQLNPTQNEFILKPNTEEKSIEKVKVIFGINLSKKILGIYLLWFLFHLILLFTHWKTEMYDFYYENFWPFTDNFNLNYYDYTEFSLYTTIPIILLLIFNIFKDNTKDIS